jgi:hypothetical protein
MSAAAIALFAVCAALIGFFALVAWGLASAGSEELERKRRLDRSRER